MNENQIAEYLYSLTDAELIRSAGFLIGTQKLRLTLAEAVECHRNELPKRATFNGFPYAQRKEAA